MIQRSIEIGPIHEFLPDIMKLGIGLNGDRIETVDTEFGFLSKNLINKAKGRSILEAQAHLSRLDPESALVMNTLISECVEEATETEIPLRAAWIRQAVAEVSDLSGALKYLARMSNRMKLDALTQVILRHREDLVDLLELLTGSRFGYDYVLPGGVRFDLSHGFSERLEKWIKNYKEDFNRIESMFYWVAYQKTYLKKIGAVVDQGNFGFVSRAAQEETRMGLISNVESRLNFALNSTVQICDKLLNYLCENHHGDFKVKLNPQVKKRDVASAAEALRGEWRLNLELSPELAVSEVRVIAPSDQTILALQEALVDESLDDFPLILQSLNISVAEVDK